MAKLWQLREVALPYGCWRCADGREILFNRDYQPIWQRHEGVVSPAPTEYVPFVDEWWFYTDATPTKGLRDRLLAILEAFLRGESVQAHT